MEDLRFGDFISPNFTMAIFKFQYSKKYFAHFYKITGKDFVEIGKTDSFSIADLVAKGIDLMIEHKIEDRYIKWKPNVARNGV